MQSSLPLPVARLHRRSFNAKSAKDRHDTAYFAWEVSVRLGVAAAPPANAGSLARASVGQWCGALKPKDRPIADEALLALFATLTEAATGTRSERKSITPRDLLDALPAYRNKVLGHGSARAPAFYEDSGRALLAGLEAAWREHLFLPEGSTLVHVDSVALDAAGGRVARAMDLSSETPVVLDGGTTHVPDGILPRRLYLRSAGTWRALHPWMLFHDDNEQLWCFNGLGRRAEYLDYASGETLGGAELEKAFPGSDAALRALLGAAEGADTAAEAPIADERRFGEYEVLGKLGEGGMGAVYLARQTSLGRTVALKMLPPERAKDAVAVGRFQREVKALARCEHPNVVKIYASGEARGTHYYAMEFVDGADLSKVAKALSSSPDFDTAVSSAFEIARGERAELFPDVPVVPRRPTASHRGEDRWRQMARFFAQAARGLEHLHANKIVHRDISPGNIMVTWPDERAVIMDLGLAAVENASVTLTKDKSAILGTLRYIAPEQLQKHLVETDRRVDIYSFGATMYELFGGRPIFDGETEPRLIAQVLREEPKLLSKLEPRLPVELAHIVHKAIEKDPARRYGGAAELAADLEAFLAGEHVTAQAPTLGYRARRWVRRHKELVAGGAAGLVIAVGVAAYAVHQARGAAQEKRTLQALSRFEALDQDAAKLGSILPGSLRALEEWVERAEAEIDGNGQIPGLDALRRDLDALRARGTKLTPDESARRIEGDANMKRIDRLRELQSWSASVLAARSGQPGPRFDESKVVIADASGGWQELNQRAWDLVRPDRVQDEREMTGLALARRALDLALVQDPKRAHMAHDTLAWALFAAGREDEAQNEAKRAFESASGDEQAIYVQGLEHLTALAKDARTPEQIEILRRNSILLDANLRSVEREIERKTTVRFDDPQAQQEYDALVQVVSGLELIAEPEVGRLARIRRWRDTARTLEEKSRAASPAQDAWKSAIAGIAAEPKYKGLAIEPQSGLLPIGRDPTTGLWEFTHVGSGEPAVRSGSGTIQADEAAGVVLTLLPGGTAWIGTQKVEESQPNYDPDLDDQDSRLPQDVELDPFFFGKYEVTQAQWSRVTGRDPSALRPGRLRGDKFATRRNPVEMVSWTAAEKGLANLGLQLPTEAQFEYALRAGTSTPWWTGDKPDSLADAANVRDQSYCTFAAGSEGCDPWDDGWMVHAPVGSLRANAFGLHDVAGNLWEWCRDLYGPADDPMEDGDGLRRAPTAEQKHAVRGGGWGSAGIFAKSAHRDAEDPGYEGATLGLRAARKLEGAWSTKDGRSSRARTQ
ncbi:MAG: bifunctional serine/threonine-protein kinase/formylglycine-generating enzyme family protein [Planctomycetota bacterium]|nr:bifunctional serine/threonine-protein kinase/formylglycine-generating enzyme family protein [Planctomycetota bacterium]